MALRTPALFMGNPAVNHTAQSMRLAKAGLLRPETGQAAATRPLTAVSGVLAGPAGTMGEVTLLSNTQFTVNPARWFIQSSDTPLGGVYEVTNDAVETIAVTAQDATQFRKAYFGVWVIDSFVAGSGDDQPHWGLVNGPLAASNPQLPAAGTLPENFLALGEFLIPPTGQSVTWTAYSLRTGLRGGILPVPVTDTRTGSHDGAYRDIPLGGTAAPGNAGGPQRWNGTAARWDSASPMDWPVCFVRQTANVAMPATVAGQPVPAMTWHNALIDTHGMFTGPSSTVLTVKQAGMYRIWGTICLTNYGAVLAPGLNINGVGQPYWAGPAINVTSGVGTMLMPAGQWDVQLNVNDTISIVASLFNNSGGAAIAWNTLQGGGAASTMGVERVR